MFNTGPTITTMAYTYFFIFAAMKRLKTDFASMDKEYASALTETLANPAHLTSFILVVFFWISWLPFLVITFLEYLTSWKIQVRTLTRLNDMTMTSLRLSLREETNRNRWETLLISSFPVTGSVPPFHCLLDGSVQLVLETTDLLGGEQKFSLPTSHLLSLALL